MYADHDHRGEHADKRHDHDGDYAEKYHRDDHAHERHDHQDLLEQIHELGERLDAAVARICELEQQTPQARQLQLEADQAAADLAESGYDRHDEPEPEDICPETSDGEHCGDWHEGGRCGACGQYGPDPETGDEGASGYRRGRR
jgi:hypothetical protein